MTDSTITFQGRRIARIHTDAELEAMGGDLNRFERQCDIEDTFETLVLIAVGLLGGISATAFLVAAWWPV